MRFFLALCCVLGPVTTQAQIIQRDMLGKAPHTVVEDLTSTSSHTLHEKQVVKTGKSFLLGPPASSTHPLRINIVAREGLVVAVSSYDQEESTEAEGRAGFTRAVASEASERGYVRLLSMNDRFAYWKNEDGTREAYFLVQWQNGWHVVRALTTSDGWSLMRDFLSSAP